MPRGKWRRMASRVMINLFLPLHVARVWLASRDRNERAHAGLELIAQRRRHPTFWTSARIGATGRCATPSAKSCAAHLVRQGILVDLDKRT